jgi:polar amino acid transport system substrate-binding protein
LLANPIRKATHHFSTSYQEELPRVRGNLRRLEQVAINLILNACQSLSGTERAIRVETSLDEEENRVVLTVADEGEGIPESVLARITDPFFTTRREAGGTGLGLAVAARIAEEHAGRLSFESEQGRGTVARLSLPIAEEEP